MLRCFHIQNISGCSWVQTDKYKVIEDEKESYCDIEIHVSWQNLNPIKKNYNAPFRICSFDIECNSIDGNFPQANRPGDCIIQIGATYTLLGQSIPYRQYIGCLKETSELDNIIVESFNTEEQLIKGFIQEILENDCDIITGYNIFFFDEKYMYDRCKNILNIDEEISLMSKLKYYPCKFKEMKLASSALGENLLRFWDTPGRVHIDLMKDIQKTFTLDSYKLDYVASKFIRGHVEKYKLLDNNNIELECKTIQDIQIGDYIHIEVIKGFISDEVGDKYLVKDIYDNKIIIQGDINLLDNKSNIFWSQAKDDVGPKDIFRLYSGNNNDRAIVAKYCIKDCKLVNLLINKLEVVTKNIEMANVCFVPLSYLFIRGQGIKLFSLCLKEYRNHDYTFPVIKPNKLYKCLSCNNEYYNKWECNKCGSKKREEIEMESSSYEGAIVFDPIPQVEYEALATKDYASLYPSSILHKNMSHETIVEDDIYDNLSGIKYYNASFKESDGNIKHCRFAQIDNKLGVIPTILNNLLKERKIIKKIMKDEKDPFKYRILDAKQLAVKITANSLYGQLGATTSPICKREIAACTTSTGREMLLLAKKYDEEQLPWIINGLKYFYNNNEIDKVNKLYDLELKSRNDDKLISKIKDFVVNDINNLTFQPVVRYGDSVINKTPLLLRLNYKTIYIDYIENIVSPTKFTKKYKNTFFMNACQQSLFQHRLINSNNTNYKEFANVNTNLEVWTDKGWTKIKQVIRHKLCKTKRLYRITTYSGSVVVSSDHSLLVIKDNIIYESTPNEVSINDILLHNVPESNNNINLEFASKTFIDELEAMNYYYNAVIDGSIMQVDFVNDEYIISSSDKFDYRIKSISLYEKEYDDYVYDLATENHHFHAGVGSIIVHNTDSIFSCYRFREGTTKVEQKQSLNIWKKIVKFGKTLILPYLDSDNKILFENIFDKYYGNITELKLIEIIPSDNMTLFIKEYMEENYIPWFWTISELVEKNYTNMFDIKLAQWAEYLLNKYNIKAINLYQTRKDYIVLPILNLVNEIFNNNTYIMPKDDTTSNFADKLYNSFEFSKEINFDYYTLHKKCKILFEKTIKDKWNKSSLGKDIELCIKKFLLSIFDVDKKQILEYVNDFMNIEDNESNIISYLNNINLKIKQDIIIEDEVKKYLLVYKKNIGKKNLETIIIDFIEKELLLSFNKDKEFHYNNVINFINNTTRISDMVDMDNINYTYYWIQPRLDFDNNNIIKVIDIYKGGNAITDKRTLEYSMKMGELSGELIKSHLPFPHDCEYEKTFWPFAIITKKRYVGNKYEFDINKYKQDFMGIVLKRRDNAPIVKEICSNIIDCLINKKDPNKAKQYTIQALTDLFDGKYDIKYFLQSRSLKLKESYKDWTRIAHVFLADKITQRQVGTAPQSGDRIEFAVVKVESNNKKLLQGEIIETPQYINLHNLEIDYLFYLTNQIMNPALQFLELVDKNAIDIFNNFISKYKNKPINLKIIKPIKEKVLKEKIIKPKNIKPKKKSKTEKIVSDILNKEELTKKIKNLILEIKKG
jgi:DNA polymerase elongation subunit (family B)